MSSRGLALLAVVAAMGGPWAIVGGANAGVAISRTAGLTADVNIAGPSRAWKQVGGTLPDNSTGPLFNEQALSQYLFMTDLRLNLTDAANLTGIVVRLGRIADVQCFGDIFIGVTTDGVAENGGQGQLALIPANASVGVFTRS
jgi:hypothetical protein